MAEIDPASPSLRGWREGDREGGAPIFCLPPFLFPSSFLVIQSDSLSLPSLPHPSEI